MDVFREKGYKKLVQCGEGRVINMSVFLWEFYWFFWENSRFWEKRFEQYGIFSMFNFQYSSNFQLLSKN